MKNRFFGNKAIAAAMIFGLAVSSVVPARPRNELVRQDEQPQATPTPQKT